MDNNSPRSSDYSQFHDNNNNNNNANNPEIFSFNSYEESFVRKSSYVATAFFVGYFVVSILVAWQWYGFRILDSAYFSVVTFSTVGYGDFVPKATGQRLLQAFVILIGVGVGTAIIGILNDRINAHNEALAEIRGVEMTERLQAIAVGKKVRTKSHTLSSGISILRLKQELPINDENDPEQAMPPISFGVQNADDDSVGIPSMHSASFSMKNSISLQQMTDILTEQYETEFKNLHHSVIINVAIVLALVAIGSLGMSTIEGWKVEDAIYWSAVTLSTVGYGDLVPTSDTGKVFTIIFILSACAFMAKTISDIAKYPVLRRMKKSEFQFVSQFANKLSKEQLQSIFGSRFFHLYPRMRKHNDVLYKSEFALLALHMLNKINSKDLFLVSQLFDSMDNRVEGLLTKDTMDLEIAAAKSEQQIREERERERESNLSSLSNASVSRLVTTAIASIGATIGDKAGRRPQGQRPGTSGRTGYPSSSLYSSAVGSPLLNQSLLSDSETANDDGWRTVTTTGTTTRSSFNIGGASIDRLPTI